MNIKQKLIEFIPPRIISLIEPFYYNLQLVYSKCRWILFGKKLPYKDIPIVINNYNRLEYVEKLIKSLQSRGYNNIHILDNDSTSMPADTVYVYIYSPDYTRGEDDEIINEDELDNVRGKINECVTAYDGEEGGECEFYIINVLAKENADYLANNVSFLTSNGIPTTNPVIITISNTNNGIAVVESYDANDEVGEFVNYLHEKVLGKVAYTHE